MGVDRLFEPGQGGISSVSLSSRRLRRTARLSRAMVRLQNSDWRQPRNFASKNYAGVYTDEDDSIPGYLLPVLEELDPVFPNELNDLSVVRTRFMASSRTANMHQDSTADYRAVAVLAGEGSMLSGHGPHGSLVQASETPLETGDVFEINNLIEQRSRLWHLAKGNLVLLVYGKH